MKKFLLFLLPLTACSSLKVGNSYIAPGSPPENPVIYTITNIKDNNVYYKFRQPDWVPDKYETGKVDKKVFLKAIKSPNLPPIGDLFP